jgi:hypothetical protein
VPEGKSWLIFPQSFLKLGKLDILIQFINRGLVKSSHCALVFEFLYLETSLAQAIPSVVTAIPEAFGERKVKLSLKNENAIIPQGFAG